MQIVYEEITIVNDIVRRKALIFKNVEFEKRQTPKFVYFGGENFPEKKWAHHKKKKRTN